MGSMSPRDVQIPISTNPTKQQEKQQHHNHEVSNPAKAMGLQSPTPVHLRNGARNSGLPCSEKEVDQLDSPMMFGNLPTVNRIRGLDLLLRTATFAFLVVALSSMLTSTQHSVVQVLGFNIKVSMKWSRTLPYRFLVVIEILICVYALLQFIIQSVVFAKKLRPVKRQMYLQLAADQVCVYLVLAAAAAAAGASRMNKAGFQSLGVQDLHLPTVCTILDKFCNRATIAIIFTLLATLTSVICAALDVCLLVLAC